MNQNPSTTETKPAARLSGLALCRSHFTEAAKAKAEADARKPTPAQIQAAFDEDLARRCEERGRQKSSKELIAEAGRYAPGGHRGRLLAAAHFRGQEERAEGIMAAQRQEQRRQPAATVPAASPWTRLVARIEAEGYTDEVRAEHERLMAVDAQKATAKPRAAASSPSPFRKRLAAFRAKVEARAAAAKPKRRAAARA